MNLKIVFFLIIVRPIVLVLLGINVRGRQEVPREGPVLLLANHNSHLDVFVLMSLLPVSVLRRTRPVAAGDYFGRGGFAGWIARHCLDCILFDRSVRPIGARDRFSGIQQAIDQSGVVLLFPEGTRGEPEMIGQLQRGVHVFLRRNKTVPVVPVLMRGLGKVLPRGEALFVPHNCDVIFSPVIPYHSRAEIFMGQIDHAWQHAAVQCLTAERDDPDR